MLEENRKKLEECFKVVFPRHTPAELRHLRADKTSEWDSIALMNLIVTVEEEFDKQLDPQRYSELDSFDAFVRELDS